MNKAFVYDPTLKDKQSSVRGIGRYLQILKESFGESWIFTDNLRIPADSVFINPFYNFLQKPLSFNRVAQKQIAVIHDLIPLKYPTHFPAGIKGNINIALNKYALRNYDLMITDSEASKKDIIKILRIKQDKIKVIYPCLPKSFLKNQQPSSPRRRGFILSLVPPEAGDKYCLYVGDATWNKNLVNLAKTIKITNVNCVFVGKVFQNVENDLRVVPKKGEHRGSPLQNIDHPWMAEYKQFLDETKGDKRFIFKGFISDEELIKLYQQATVNILPSRDEGFGFSYLEAASQHCPSVLADVPVLKEISGKNALFADPEKPDKIANAIGELFFDDTKIKQIGELAFKRSLFFSKKNFKDQLSKIIDL